MDIFDFHMKQTITDNKIDKQISASQHPTESFAGNEKKRIFIFGKHSMDKSIASIEANILPMNKKNSFIVI